MPILTKPSEIVKDVGATFTLDKTLLAANPIVAADAYFVDHTNWKTVIVVFESPTGGQSEKVIFDATQTTPTGTFKISAKARDEFQVKRIDIYDFDGGHLSVPRTSLSAEEYDVNLGIVSYSFRHIKMEGYNSWNTSNTNRTQGTTISIAEFKLKLNGTVETLTNYPKTASVNPAPQTVLGGTAFNYFVNGVTTNPDYTYWEVSDVNCILFTMDLGEAKEIQEVHIAPQANFDGPARQNMPKTFKIFGSNDGTTWTEILAVAHTDVNEATAWEGERYRVFPIG